MYLRSSKSQTSWPRLFKASQSNEGYVRINRKILVRVMQGETNLHTQQEEQQNACVPTAGRTRSGVMVTVTMTVMAIR